jgi:glycosyltransferase involved in cell wall biosynthesis
LPPSSGSTSPLPGELRRILYVQELVAELRRRFEDDPPDFIYERAALFGLAGVTLARAWNVPLLVEVNAPLAAEQSTYRGANLGELASLAERRLLTEADAVLAVSAALREHVLSARRCAGAGPRLPNGVNPELFHPAPRDLRLRERLGLDGGPVLGFLGGLRPWHGVEALPDVLGKLSRRHRRLRLVVAGDGPLRFRTRTGPAAAVSFGSDRLFRHAAPRGGARCGAAIRHRSRALPEAGTRLLFLPAEALRITWPAASRSWRRGWGRSPRS